MNKRPLSPHLQVYKLPLAAIISITHRIVGVGMYIMVLFFVAYLYAIKNSSCFHCLNAVIHDWFVQIKLKGILIAGSFFLASELRYIFWSFGKGLEKKIVFFSNYIILLAAALLTVLFVWG